jgi:D-arabinose 1-dehydrogenase-like Zn-dependent alcohol dehydrogenase
MILYTEGKGTFVEADWVRPLCGDSEIAVKAVLTGVCRSDIDMMNGEFGPLPINMSGHEGLGQVIEVGNNIKNISVGDFVATRGEPAYADEYNVRDKEFVVVPSADPKYILEPVACGINVILQARDLIEQRSGEGKKALILGSGFLAWVAYNTIKLLDINLDVSVLGHSNKHLWGDVLSESVSGNFDVVIDLVGKCVVNVNNEALIINGVAKNTTKDVEEQLLWKACTTVRPSPRTSEFFNAMILARDWIQAEYLKVDSFWTKGYDRKTEWHQAFEHGNNRPANYSRGYLQWR